MNLDSIPDDPEDSRHSSEERAAAASRSTWIAALIVGFLVAKMGWGFGWDAMHDPDLDHAGPALPGG